MGKVITTKRRIRIKETGKSRTYRANQGWRTIQGRRIFFRSGWEVNYAWWLQFLKEKGQIKEWLYEPERFYFDKIKSGTTSYLPDFKVIRNDGTHYWIEVKGYMDARSATKIKRFRKYFPKEHLEIVDAARFREIRQLCSFVKDRWEGIGTEGDKNELD